MTAVTCKPNRKRDYHQMTRTRVHALELVGHPSEARFMMCRVCGRAVYRKEAAELFDAGLAIPYDAARPSR